MWTLKRTAVCMVVLSLGPLWAQEASTGFTVPLTLSAGAMHTHRLQVADEDARPVAVGFRAMLYPTLKLGSHWVASASVQLNSSPYFYFETTSAYGTELRTRLIQGYVGYSFAEGRKSITVKAGKLVSAFGSFPLRYDDALNPLIDAPLSYGSGEYGRLFPITLYGLPGAQVDVTLGRVDTRFQFTNSAPVNPKDLLSADQNPNWAAGAGYTIRQGFRVGASIHRGGYLTLGRFLTRADNPREWPSTGVGVDVQWARGRWSLNGEWQRFYYPYPRYLLSPAVQFSYVEAKTVLHPRLYVASRFVYKNSPYAQPFGLPRPIRFAARQATELAVGYHLNRSQLLKVGYEWLHIDGVSGTRDNVLGIQFITSIDRISKAFH